MKIFSVHIVDISEQISRGPLGVGTWSWHRSKEESDSFKLVLALVPNSQYSLRYL